uniref:Photosystem II extrinsic protein O n=1 Tax=Cyanothece sp. (strain PCC 7425 / ATCC 29141) TaxID=395961 RepID=B8HTW9_CYAP4
MRYRAFIVAFLAFCLGMLTLGGNALAAKPALTYDQIRGTGLANNCPSLDETARGSFALDPNQSYRMSALCLQPTTFLVKEEPKSRRQEADFVPAKVMTRYTSSIDQVQGPLKFNSNGSLTFTEEDGFDFQPITVQLPGGERVPLLFSVKNLVATTQPGLTSINTSTDFEGDFNVPSYRTSNFLDPKGRGLATGYDNAVALPAGADEDELTRANVKRFDVTKGKISLQVSKVNSRTGEIAGTFESEQLSDDDMGAHESKEMKIQGIFYSRIEPVG